MLLKIEEENSEFSSKIKNLVFELTESQDFHHLFGTLNSHQIEMSRNTIVSAKEVS